MKRPGRIFRAFLLACCGQVLVAGSHQVTAREQATETVELPDWVVLVLQPVSGDRVRPVTGVVISEQGLVIVPMDFAAPGDQLVVLDGGTDIIANGRAAVVRKQLPEVGLTVLSVPRLHRSPARFSTVPLQADDHIYLAAFPPAELISQGSAPLRIPSQASLHEPLPNVTGPLLDDCGNLVGFSSAQGVQSMETTKSPTYAWKDQLLPAFRSVPVVLRESPCPLPETAATQAQSENHNAETAIQDSTIPVAETNRPRGFTPGDTGRSGAAGGHSTQLAGWIAIVLLFALAGLVAWWIKRLVRRKQTPVSLLTDSYGHVPRARASGPMDSPAPASAADCRLELNGRLPNGAPFTACCEVNSAAINVVIGRGQVDLPIDSQVVHREHVRLSGSAESLTISDLGSPRGTWINRVPCLKGEIMFLESEDTIFLGDVSFHVTLQPLRADALERGEAAG